MSYSAFVQFLQDCKLSLDWPDFRMAFALGKAGDDHQMRVPKEALRKDGHHPVSGFQVQGCPVKFRDAKFWRCLSSKSDFIVSEHLPIFSQWITKTTLGSLGSCKVKWMRVSWDPNFDPT